MKEECEFCAFAGGRPDTCDRCGDRGRHEAGGRSIPVRRGVRGTYGRLLDTLLGDGVHALGSGASYVTQQHNIIEIRVPKEPAASGDSSDARLMRHHDREAALREIGDFLGLEIAPYNMWRIDPHQQVMIYPRAMDAHAA